jgi:large subunit ribosomal protein L21
VFQGHSYLCTQSSPLAVNSIVGEAGATVEFGEVLLVGEGANVKLGAPLLKGSKVTATIVRHGKSAKVSVIKFKRRAHYLRQKTHRQHFTEVKITDIVAG